MTKITMTYDYYRKENEVKHFETEVELRSFIIRFQNICKRYNKKPYFKIAKGYIKNYPFKLETNFLTNFKYNA